MRRFLLRKKELPRITLINTNNKTPFVKIRAISGKEKLQGSFIFILIVD